MVAMSSTTGASCPAGTATAIGLVLSRLSAALQAGMASDEMRVAGRTALNRAREYDGIGQSVEALKEYDKAAQWLPPDDPNRALARQRADVLRAGGK